MPVRLSEEEVVTIRVLAEKGQNHCPIGLKDWQEILAGDEAMAAALLDRLLHRCHVLNIRGRSYRLRDLERMLKGGPQGIARRLGAPVGPTALPPPQAAHPRVC